MALGIGSVIGSGIFTLTGTAAAGLKFDYHSVLKAPVLDLMLQGRNALGTMGRPGAGPAISISFLLVAIACGFAALCYAELASMIPVSGSAYTYAYATLGEIFAWIIGWDLILEYAVANMAVAVGFGAYFNDLLDNVFGFHLPAIAFESRVRRRQAHRRDFQRSGVPAADGAELDPGARGQGERRGQQRDGADQGRGDPAVRLRRREGCQHG